MDEETVLPNSQYININLGLKYLNGNKKLYLKILNSFLTRYQNFNIHALKENEFKNEMHTLKGLSSTLGMKALSDLTQNLHAEQNKELLLAFSEVLTNIIEDLRTLETKTLLIIDDNINDIDCLIEVLDRKYDIMVITNPNDALESIGSENINIVLLSQTLDTRKIRKSLEQKRISIIELSKPIEINNLLLAIRSA